MNRMFSTLAAALTAVAVSSGCGSDCGDDSVSVLQVYAETGLSVADTVDARTAFEAFVLAVQDSGEMFPDGSSSWTYVSSTAISWASEQFWVVVYDPTAPPGNLDEVYIDRTGRVLEISLNVHAPC